MWLIWNGQNWNQHIQKPHHSHFYGIPVVFQWNSVAMRAAILEIGHFEVLPVFGELASIKIWIPHPKKPLKPEYGASLQKLKCFGIRDSTNYQITVLTEPYSLVHVDQTCFYETMNTEISCFRSEKRNSYAARSTREHLEKALSSHMHSYLGWEMIINF